MKKKRYMDFLVALADYIQEKTKQHKYALMVKAKGVQTEDLDKLLDRLDVDNREEWAKILVSVLDSGVSPILYNRLLLLSPLRCMKIPEIRSFLPKSE